MPPRYDMLVIDLDGTLLTPDGSVSPGNVQAIDRARQAGIEIVIATGRALAESIAPLEAIGHDGVGVMAGGSLLCDVATGHTLDRSVMDHDLVIDVTTALLRHDHKVLLLKDAHATGYDYLVVGPGELDPASRWWFERLPVRVRFVHELDEDPHELDTVRAAVVATEMELAPIARELVGALGDRAFLQHWGAVTENPEAGGATHLLEVFTPDVSKWTMVSTLCEKKGVDPARVAAIGDGLNDVEIVREAGLGVAMGNADARVTAVSDRITADNRSDGVARTIEQILDGNW